MQDERLINTEGSFEAFENCREQGLRLVTDDCEKTIVFCENRNSDDIVVYHNNEYEYGTKGYSKKFWDSAKYFSCDDFKGAVDYIVKLLK